MIVSRTRLFALISLTGCILTTHAAISRRVELQHYDGASRSPNWSGEFCCPVDYDIDIKSLKISKLCKGRNCNKLLNYQLNKLNEMRNNCAQKNTCSVNLWQQSRTDDNNVFIDYDCKSLRLPYLFATKMVKRFYPNDVTSQASTYCRAPSTRHRRRLDDNYIGTNPPTAYSFQGFVEARMLLVQARARGYYSENVYSNGMVSQTFIRRTRPHPRGGTIDITEYVVANLTLRSSDTRMPFSTDINNYLNLCGIRRSPTNPDDGGHLVAYTLGGDDTKKNVVPMARSLNRIQGIWYHHEQRAREYLRTHRNGTVRWEVLVFYGGRSTEPFRPIAFALRYTQYEDKLDLSHGVERIETFINENEDYRNDQCTLNLEDFFNPPNQQDITAQQVYTQTSRNSAVCYD